MHIDASACLILQRWDLSEVFIARCLVRSEGEHMFFPAEHGVIPAVLHMETRGTITGYEEIVRAEYRNRLASH